MSIRQAYDFDGVICADAPAWFSKLPAVMFYPFLWWHQVSALPLMRPQAKSVIITGRLECDARRTYRWMRRHGISNRVYFNPWGPDDAVAWKQEVIMRLLITHYVESDPAIAAVLSEALPHVEVVCPR